MKIGEVIYASTHAELLNKLLGTHYEAWMKSSIKLSGRELIWMIELGHFVSKSGWTNILEKGGTRISEKHQEGYDWLDGHSTWVRLVRDGKPWDSLDRDRIVFDMDKSGARKYIFRGVFRLKKEECTEDENVWDRIAEEYPFPAFHINEKTK